MSTKETKEKDNKALHIGVVMRSASPDKKEINHKNSKYCTDPNECYQTIACRGGNKKLCKYFDMSVK